jgi:hypothetical protein
MELVLLLHQLLHAVAWQQDRFAIGGGWFIPPSDAHYAEFAEANFTFLVGWQASNITGVLAQLAACERYGLGAMVSTCGGDATTGAPGACVGAPGVVNSPAFWGYQLADEPSASAFPALANWSQAIGRASPGLRMINLLPNYATSALLGARTYGQYIEEFMQAVNPDILCMDHCEFSVA